MPSLLDKLNTPGTFICRLPGTRRFGLFMEPLEIKSVDELPGIITVVEWLEENLRHGRYAAAFLSYEAAKAFDPAFSVKGISGFPLLYAAVYDGKPEIFEPDIAPLNPRPHIDIRPEIGRYEYVRNVGRIKSRIHDGDTYQVNFTFRARGGAVANPAGLFLDLFSAHPVPFAAFANTGDFQIISNSPELFLERISGTLRCRPMKGTAKRMLTAQEDFAASKALSKDAKNRAENVMIADMVRNDFGRICIPGTISAETLFEVETYPTVHQMVSEVRGHLRPEISLAEIFSATFPAASITGAPKVKTMEIIDTSEKSPRKIYTGSIGCFMPGGNFCMNVAIRTLLCCKTSTEIGIGSGIVADSQPESEWDECLAKKEFVNFSRPQFEVLETILWERRKGFHFLVEHLKRARNSQKYFGRKWNAKAVRKCLSDFESHILQDAEFARVRLRISQDGNAAAEFTVLEGRGWGKEKLKLCLSPKRNSSRDVFLFHKTTNRSLYDNEFKRALGAGFDEVVFLNEKDEVTEGAISNIFIGKDGKWFTPPLECGLLPGIWRAKTIRELHAREKVLKLEDLTAANRIIVGNSVRGDAEAMLVY